MPTTLLAPEHEAKIIELFQISLNTASDIPQALNIFSNYLTDCKDIPHETGIILANSIYNYNDLILNREYLNALRDTFNSVYDLIYDKVDVNFKIEGRRKGVVNTVEKMLRLLKQGKSLDLFRDSMGIRVILFGEETASLQEQCYNICNEIIQFMLEKHFTLCEADKIVTDTKLKDGINILIPEHSLITPAYQAGVKDYVLQPKANGYQSLHMIFRARNSSFIEIQVRTEEMHLNAEFHDANHILYKVDKYGERLHSKIDFSKIHMPGFRCLNNGLIYDDIGLQTSQLTVYRTKSFQ